MNQLAKKKDLTFSGWQVKQIKCLLEHQKVKGNIAGLISSATNTRSRGGVTILF